MKNYTFDLGVTKHVQCHAISIICAFPISIHLLIDGWNSCEYQISLINLSFECTKFNISSFQRWTSLTPMVYKTCINSQYVRFFLWRGWKCCSNKAWCRHTWCRISSSGLMYISSPLFCNSPFCFYNNKENSKLYSKTQYW